MKGIGRKSLEKLRDLEASGGWLAFDEWFRRHGAHGNNLPTMAARGLTETFGFCSLEGDDHQMRIGIRLTDFGRELVKEWRDKGMFLKLELEGFRDLGKLPESLSKRFLEALAPHERRSVFAQLRARLDSELDGGEITEPELLTLVFRLARVQKMRREKGELANGK